MNGGDEKREGERERERKKPAPRVVLVRWVVCGIRER